MIETEDLAKCGRCEEMVGAETLISIGDWKICEDCWDDL